MFHKILVALDDTEMSRHVFDEALNLAKATQAHLCLLNIINPWNENYRDVPFGIGLEGYYPVLYEEAMKRHMEQVSEVEAKNLEQLNQMASQATEAGVTVEINQKRGDPSQTICTIATEWQADLIIMGRRGYTGLNELLLGSVSNYVLHRAPCSVLTVHREPIAPHVEPERSQETASPA